MRCIDELRGNTWKLGLRVVWDYGCDQKNPDWSSIVEFAGYIVVSFGDEHDRLSTIGSEFASAKHIWSHLTNRQGVSNFPRSIGRFHLPETLTILLNSLHANRDSAWWVGSATHPKCYTRNDTSPLIAFPAQQSSYLYGLPKTVYWGSYEGPYGFWRNQYGLPWTPALTIRGL